MWEVKVMGFELYFLFYNFFLYCFFGWIYESCLVSFKKRMFVNRGFLNGPLIPIYGFGATTVYMFLYSIQENAFLVFVCGALIASVLEYVTSYVMEKLFHAKWWDYTNYKYNLKGRICLLASFLWGLLSIFMTEVLQPFMNKLIHQIPRTFGETVAVVIFSLFLIDFTVTVVYTLEFDKKLVKLTKIRSEIADYIESTRFYETKEEMKERWEEFSIANLSDSFKEQFELHISSFPNKEELEQKLKGLFSRYQKAAELKNIVQKRILRAFPTMKSLRSDRILEEIRKKRK